MPRITVNKLVLLTPLSFFISIIYLFSSSSKSEINNYLDGTEYDFDLLDTDIKYVRQRLDEIHDPSQNRVQFMKLDDHAYSFSAFTDDRNGNMGHKYVRILMFLAGDDEFACMINEKKSSGVTLYELSENHRMLWGVYILNCVLPDGITFNDVNSIKISRLSTGSFVHVPIRYRIQDEKSMTPDEYDYKMSTCVPALYGNVYYARKLIEFVELNNIQGIEKTYIYYNPIEMTDEATMKTLKYYSDNSKISLIEFVLPFTTRDVWYHGQLAAIADCLLRNTGITEYTFFNDFDEFFVPVQPEKNLLETVEGLFENRTIASMRTAVKYISTKINRSPITLKNAVSTKQFETRFTKCVVRPEMVFEQGIHHTSRVIQGDYEASFHDGSLLRVYHYRKPRYCCEEESIVKDRYENQLQQEFDSVVQLLEV